MSRFGTRSRVALWIVATHAQAGHESETTIDKWRARSGAWRPAITSVATLRGLSPTTQHSKLKFQRQLNGSRTSNRVQRVQTAIAESAVQSSCGLPKRAGPHKIVNAAEIWMIEDIEKFGTKLEIYPLRNVELAMESKIHLPWTESPEHVPTQIPLDLGGAAGCWVGRYRAKGPATRHTGWTSSCDRSGCEVDGSAARAGHSAVRRGALRTINVEGNPRTYVRARDNETVIWKVKSAY